MLGLYSIHVFLLALQQAFNIQSSRRTEICCDNEKALLKASDNPRRIPMGAKCPDILRSLRNAKRDLVLPVTYTHVRAHMDDVLKWEELSIHQQLNVQCDLLAKAAVSRMFHDSLEGNPMTQMALPREYVSLFIDGEKITSDPADDLRYFIGRQVAHNFYTLDLGWPAAKFEQVCWDSLRDCLASKSDGFKLWLTKQTSNFCASRKQLARHSRSADDRCPSCVRHKEDAAHLCICPNEDRTLLLKADTEALELWLSNDHTHPEIAYWVPKYILCRGSVSFVDLGPMSPAMRVLAESQDIIGWRAFMEGRISVQFRKVQALHLASHQSFMTASQWTRTLVGKLLQITHSQWIFRNLMLHNKTYGYYRMVEQLDLLREIEQLMEISVDDIPSDRSFLLEFDMEELASLDFETQSYWVQSMRAAQASQSNTVNEHLGLPPISHIGRMVRTRRPWESRWGISQVLEQIRRDCRILNADTFNHASASPFPRPRWMESVASFALGQEADRRRKPD